ncbi:MAG: class I SAM-dependent methyltransferase [Actinomycetota bacterium]
MSPSTESGGGWTGLQKTDFSSIQDRITAYWSRHAGSYHDYQTDEARRGPARAAWATALSQVLPTPPARVLDLGTGTGYIAILLAELGYRVTGVDLSEPMLELGRTHANGLANPPQLLVGDAVAPDFPSGSFDLLTARYLLWTLREPARALGNWLGLLKPGGMLVVIDSTWFPDGIHSAKIQEPDGKEQDFRELYDRRVVAALPFAEARSEEGMVQIIQQAGFTGVETTSLHGIWDLERRLGVAPGHRVQMQVLIKGVSPLNE